MASIRMICDCGVSKILDWQQVRVIDRDRLSTALQVRREYKNVALANLADPLQLPFPFRRKLLERKLTIEIFGVDAQGAAIVTE